MEQLRFNRYLNRFYDRAVVNVKSVTEIQVNKKISCVQSR